MLSASRRTSLPCVATSSMGRARASSRCMPRNAAASCHSTSIFTKAGIRQIQIVQRDDGDGRSGLSEQPARPLTRKAAAAGEVRNSALVNRDRRFEAVAREVRTKIGGARFECVDVFELSRQHQGVISGMCSEVERDAGGRQTRKQQTNDVRLVAAQPATVITRSHAPEESSCGAS